MNSNVKLTIIPMIAMLVLATVAMLAMGETPTTQPATDLGRAKEILSLCHEAVGYAQAFDANNLVPLTARCRELFVHMNTGNSNRGQSIDPNDWPPLTWAAKQTCMRLSILSGHVYGYRNCQANKQFKGAERHKQEAIKALPIFQATIPGLQAAIAKAEK